MVIYIFSDNGASAEGMDGSVAELNAQNGIASTVDEHIAVMEQLGGLEEIGGPKMDNIYHSAWAWLGDSPFRYTKLIAADWGGTRTPMVISWPKASSRTRRRVRNSHVNDVAPTLYEILDITPPQDRRWPRAGSDRRRELCLAPSIRRCAGGKNSVLRDHGQPWNLSRRLDGQYLWAPNALGRGDAGCL